MSKNCENFCKDLLLQANGRLPDYLTQEQKDYISNLLYNFMELTYNSLEEDKKECSEIELITQYIGEYTYFFSIDLLRAKISYDLCDKILQKIAFVIFEVGKIAYKKIEDIDTITSILEHHVVKTYKEEINRAYQDGEIAIESRDYALFDDFLIKNNFNIEKYNELKKDNEKTEVSKEQKSTKIKFTFWEWIQIMAGGYLLIKFSIYGAALIYLLIMGKLH